MKKTDVFKNSSSYTAGMLIGKWVSLVEASRQINERFYGQQSQ